MIEDIKSLLRQVPQFSFDFVHREASGVAHRLATFSLSQKDLFLWFEVSLILLTTSYYLILSRSNCIFPDIFLLIFNKTPLYKKGYNKIIE